MDTPDTPAEETRPVDTAKRHGGRVWRWVLLAGLLVVLVVPLLWPVPELIGVVPPRELADLDSKFIEVNGLTVHYKESAPASPTCNVILLHGFGASTFSWRDTVLGLGERCRVVAFDRPGFGLTERPMPGEWEGSSPYSPTAQADLTIALMDELGMQRAILVGHSAGAGVAVLAAARHPDRVSALVLEAPAVVAGGGPPAWATPLLRTPQARRIGPLFLRRFAGEGSDDLVRGAYADASLVTRQTLDGYRRPLSAQDWDRGLWELTAAPRPDDPADVLPELTMPVLVIYGEADAYVSPDDSRRTAKLIPASQSTSIPNVGHIPHEEVPAAFETIVFRFLDDLDAASIP